MAPTSSSNKETIIAIKTFSDGVSLPASDVNTYLTNSGLVYVTSTTVPSGASSVTVSNCFSATYDSYRIVYTGGNGSVAQGIAMQLGATITGYQYVLSYLTYAGTQTNTGATTTAWLFVGESNTNTNLVCMDLHNPNLAKYTLFASTYVGSVAGYSSGQLTNTTAYTAFTLSVSGTMTGGTITVYGYRKA